MAHVIRHFEQFLGELELKVREHLDAEGNAFRRSATYILIGVQEVRGGKSNVLGIDAADHLDDQPPAP